MENISAAAVLDLILTAFVLASVIIGASRGLVKSVWKIAALVITIVIVMILKMPFTSMLAQTDTADRLYKDISARVTPTVSQNLYDGELSFSQQSEIAKTLNLPAIVINRVLSDHDAQAAAEGTYTAVERAADNIARSITMMILGFVAAVVLFVFVKLVLFILYHVLDAFTKLPLVHATNHMLGAAIGLVTSLAAVWAVLALISFIATDNSDVYAMIEQTYVVKYFYNYNILLNLFMKI